MKNKMFFFALCISAYFPKDVTTDAETVWLREVTTRLQIDKRGVTDPDLPDQMSFHLKRRTQNLVLNLKRNYQIDPNTDIYIMKKLKDGRSVLEKKQNLGKADVAYYQDMENGAFMTARCVKRSSGQCDIIINGNIRLGDRNYNLRPLGADDIQNDFLEIMGLRGKRYVFQDQENIQSGISVDNNDKTRNRNSYFVDVVVVADSSVWDLFFAIARYEEPQDREDKTHRLLREYFLHIVNGAHQQFQGIADPSISIEVSIRAVVSLPQRSDFPYINSRVEDTGTETKIDGNKYLLDLQIWDHNVASYYLQNYDQVILFTKHVMHSGNPFSPDDDGRSFTSGVCDPGRRVQIVHVDDFFSTIRSTAHGLGHSLGASHDGTGESAHCKPDARYIMSPIKPAFYPQKKHSPTLWEFSGCSVEAFKRKLVKKTCLNTTLPHPLDILDEMRNILLLRPGEHYNPDEQCVIIYGVGSKYCGKRRELICVTMRCTDPEGTHCITRTIPAAEGTSCGDNKHCQKGLCVARQ